MALISLNYKSDILNTVAGIRVILPEKRAQGEPLPVLYLLHGFSDDETSWCSQTSIERYVRHKNLAVVMPSAFNSFYTDMACGAYDFYSHMMRELIPFCRENFAVSPRREDNFIAGLSMGGYGAFRFALTHPDVFSQAASFSGALDIARLATTRDMSPIFHYPLEESENDLFALARKAAAAPEKPRLYQWCGTEDFLYEDNIRFRDFISELGFDYTYKEKSGDHSWGHWDDQLRRLFVWLGIPNHAK